MKKAIYFNEQYKNHYTFDTNAFGDTVFYNVYLNGYTAKPEDIKTDKNGKRFVVCDCELKISEKNKKPFYVVKQEEETEKIEF